MISKSVFIVLCIGVMTLSVFVIALVMFSKYLIERNNKLEALYERRTEQLCEANNKADYLQRENNQLYKKIKELKRNE